MELKSAAGKEIRMFLELQEQAALEASRHLQSDFRRKLFDAIYDVLLAYGREVNLPRRPDGKVDWDKLGMAIHRGIDVILDGM